MRSGINDYAIGDLLREWRGHRGMSQMDLALDADVSTRHLSYVENGRATPSADLVLRLAEQLRVPLREQNTMLMAAGHAPRFSEHRLTDAVLADARATVARLLTTHEPFPAVAVDRRWDIVLANSAASGLLDGLPERLVDQPNVYRLCLHPNGLAARTLNLTEWATFMLRQLRRDVLLTNDRELRELEREVLSYPGMPSVTGVEAAVSGAEGVLVPVQLDAPGGPLSLFTTLTSFGTPRDITLEELVVELFWPADDRTRHALRSSPT